MFIVDYVVNVGTSGAQTLADLGVSAAHRDAAERVHVTARGGAISYLYGATDGVAPTASVGHIIEDKGAFVLESNVLVNNLQMISTSGTVSVSITLIGP